MRVFAGMLIGVCALLIVPLPLITSVHAASDVSFYRRSDFSDEASRFSRGATVYIKAELDFEPAEAKVRLKNDEGSEIKSTDLEKKGRPATGAFSLPDESGGYLIEADFRGEGSRFQFSKNIMVGEGSGSQYVEVKVSNKIALPSLSAGQAVFYPGGTQRRVPAVPATGTVSQSAVLSSYGLSSSSAGSRAVAPSVFPT